MKIRIDLVWLIWSSGRTVRRELSRDVYTVGCQKLSHPNFADFEKMGQFLERVFFARYLTQKRHLVCFCNMFQYGITKVP